MADIDKTIMFTLQQEDSSLNGVVTKDAFDSGGRTRFGISEHSNPLYAKNGFFTCDKTTALKMAIELYRTKYVEPLHIDEIADQQVANALVSFAINEGVEISIAVAQKALKNATKSSTLSVDGVMGKVTLSLLNEIPSAVFLSSLREEQRKHYDTIISANPKNLRFKNGWMKRIDENTTKI